MGRSEVSGVRDVCGMKEWGRGWTGLKECGKMVEELKSIVCGIGLMCKFTTDVLRRGSTDMDLFSPIAQHRMLATSYVDVGSPGSRSLEHKKII